MGSGNPERRKALDHEISVTPEIVRLTAPEVPPETPSAGRLRIKEPLYQVM